MGCGKSTDDVKMINLTRTQNSSKDPKPQEKVSEKQAAIDKVFSDKPGAKEAESPPQNDFIMPKLNLVKRKAPPEKNVNFLIEDNTKVWNYSP